MIYDFPAKEVIRQIWTTGCVPSENSRKSLPVPFSVEMGRFISHALHISITGNTNLRRNFLSAVLGMEHV